MWDESGPPAKKQRIEEELDSSEEEDEPECLIHMLPDEVLIDVFERLFYEERKQCALVCHRWLSILRSGIFMLRTKYTISHCFGMVVDTAMQIMLSNCGHIDFNDCGSLPGFVCDNLISVQTALDQPRPSSAPPVITIEDFLFCGKLPVRSFTVTALFGRIPTFIRDRLSMMPNLEEFTMNILPVQDGQPEMEWDEDSNPPWLIRHTNIRSLTAVMYAGVMSFKLELPRLKRFVIEIANDNELDALISCSSQLDELGILFYFSRGLEQMLTYPFPALKKLTMKRSGNNRSPDRNTPVDDASAERFMKGAPLLADVTLRCNIAALKMLRAVSLLGAQSITKLTLLDVLLPRSLFVLISGLKKLEFLKLKKCAVEDGGPLRELDFPHLKQLILINSGTCIRIDRGLSCVTHFKYTIDPKLTKICTHMMLLEDFEIKLRTKYPVSDYVRDHFHSLPKLTELHTLRLSGMKTTNRPWNFCRPLPAVKRLVLRKCHLVRGDFHHLPKLFPSLRKLELDETRIAYKRCPEGVHPVVHFVGRLKQFLPACSMLINPTTVALPLATVLDMEDERQWHLKQVRLAGMVVEPLYERMKGRVEARRRRAEVRRLEMDQD